MSDNEKTRKHGHSLRSVYLVHEVRTDRPNVCTRHLTSRPGSTSSNGWEIVQVDTHTIVYSKNGQRFRTPWSNVCDAEEFT